MTATFRVLPYVDGSGTQQGAEWIWNLADLHFPGAVQIFDLYHARQHLRELARKLRPNEAVKQKAWMKKHQHMRGPKFRRQHLFAGSGVIEAGCKTVIGSRLRQSGMFWSVRVRHRPATGAMLMLNLPSVWRKWRESVSLRRFDNRSLLKK